MRYSHLIFPRSLSEPAVPDVTTIWSMSSKSVESSPPNISISDCPTRDLECRGPVRGAECAVERKQSAVLTLQYDDLHAVRKPRVGSRFARNPCT